MKINDYYRITFQKKEDVIVRIVASINNYMAKCIVVVGNDLCIKGTYDDFCFCADCGQHLITNKVLIHKFDKELVFG